MEKNRVFWAVALAFLALGVAVALVILFGKPPVSPEPALQPITENVGPDAPTIPAAPYVLPDDVQGKG